LKRLLILAVLLLLLTAGCTNKQANKDPWQYSMQSGMGTVNDSMDYQEYSYSFTVNHMKETNLEDVGITLQLNKAFRDRLTQQSGLMEEHFQTLEPNRTVTLEGKLVLETKNLTKEKIIELGPVIDSVLVTWKENGETKNSTLKPFDSDGNKQ
jgi:hypothetical protein